MESLSVFLVDPMNSGTLLKIIHRMGEYFLTKKEPILVLRNSENVIIYFEALRGANSHLGLQESLKKGHGRIEPYMLQMPDEEDDG